MKYKIQTKSIYELGQRTNQEDSIFPAHNESTSEDRLFILCDGMGGHEKGEVASSTVCEVMSQTILSRWSPGEPLSDQLLQQAIDEAYDALDAKDNGEVRKMGTTMTILCLHSEGATVAHIGDSRVYQLRPAAKDEPAHIVFKTQDHSLVNDLIRIGEITEEEAKNHPQKNVITRAMQPCLEHRSKADIAHLTDIREGDYFYLCSDGMLEQTSDDNLLYMLSKPDATLEEKVDMLRDVTSENKDNHTAHLIYIKGVEGSLEVQRVQEAQEEYVPKGTRVTPEYESTKPKRATPPLFIAALLFCVATIAAMFYLRPVVTNLLEKGNDSVSVKELQRDTRSTTTKQHQAKKDSTKVNTSDTVKAKVDTTTAKPEKKQEITPAQQQFIKPKKASKPAEPSEAPVVKEDSESKQA